MALTTSIKFHEGRNLYVHCDIPNVWPTAGTQPPAWKKEEVTSVAELLRKTRRGNYQSTRTISQVWVCKARHRKLSGSPGWPKSWFMFFCKMVHKYLNELFGELNKIKKIYLCQKARWRKIPRWQSQGRHGESSRHEVLQVKDQQVA